MKRKHRGRRHAAAPPVPEQAAQPAAEGEDRGEVVDLAEQVAAARPEGGWNSPSATSTRMRASHTGDEAVGGSVATPDHHIVNEIGSALGVAQPSETEVRTSEEILRERDRFFWHFERRLAKTEEDAREHRSRADGPG